MEYPLGICDSAAINMHSATTNRFNLLSNRPSPCIQPNEVHQLFNSTEVGPPRKI